MPLVQARFRRGGGDGGNWGQAVVVVAVVVAVIVAVVGRRLVGVVDGGGMGRWMVIDVVVGGNVRLMVSWVEG